MKKESITRQSLPPRSALPPLGSIVVRSDAAWFPVSNNAGLGWVILEETGSRSFNIAKQCVASPLTAKGLALREAVRHCKDEGLKMVAFESDSAQLVKAISSGPPPKELYSLIADVSAFVSAFDFVSFSWIPRERNSIADCLAKGALIVSEQQVVGDVFIDTD